VEKASTGIRIVEIILGAITVGLSALVLSNPGFTTLFFVTLLGIALVMVGISKIIAGAVLKENTKSLRGISIAIGVISVIGGIFALVNPIGAVAALILVISIFILIHGVGLVASGITQKGTQKGLRIANIVLGVIAVAFAALIYANPDWAVAMMVILLALGLLFNGVASIVSGIFGIRITKV
jgi:uncharacterized membrane protein HdeD (DUF308 family)